MSIINQKIAAESGLVMASMPEARVYQLPGDHIIIRRKKPEQKIKESTVADFMAIEKAKQKREMRRAKRLKYKCGMLISGWSPVFEKHGYG